MALLEAAITPEQLEKQNPAQNMATASDAETETGMGSNRSR